MCDLGTLEAVLGTAAAFITASLALVAIATALNGGFFSAPAAPAPMFAAGATTLAAVAALVAARVLVEGYFQCMGAPAECLGDYDNLVNALAALITTLGIQAAACIVVGAAAWIPWAVLPAQAAIVASLVVQLALIPTLIVFWTDLRNCLEEASVASSTGPLVVSISYFVILALGTAYFSRGRSAKIAGNGGSRLRQ